MGAKKKRSAAGRLFSGLLGLACAAVLGFLFYGVMVYQLTGDDAPQEAQTQASPAPLVPGQSTAALFPGELLALPGLVLEGEQARDEEYGGKSCRVITRTYRRDDGAEIKAFSAYPAAYVQRVAQEGFAAQLVTGFSIGMLDAVYALRGSDAALYARNGECIYVITAPADEQAVYALGAAAVLGN